MGGNETHVDRIREQFTRQADAYAQNRQARDEASHQALVAISGVQADDGVLDVACGPGFLTLALATQCREAVGVDATPALLDHARSLAAERGVQNVRFEEGDATRLPFDDGTFDAAVCRAAFHHFPDPGMVLREMARAVRPGGRIVVADMLGSENSEQASRRDHVDRLCDPTHVRSLSEPELHALFGDSGVDVENVFRGTMDYDVEEWLSHGGPSESVADEIRRLFEADLEDDRTGFRARREGDVLRFTQDVAVFLGRRP